MSSLHIHKWLQSKPVKWRWWGSREHHTNMVEESQPGPLHKCRHQDKISESHLEHVWRHKHSNLRRGCLVLPVNAIEEISVVQSTKCCESDKLYKLGIFSNKTFDHFTPSKQCSNVWSSVVFSHFMINRQSFTCWRYVFIVLFEWRIIHDQMLMLIAQEGDRTNLCLKYFRDNSYLPCFLWKGRYEHKTEQ